MQMSNEYADEGDVPGTGRRRMQMYANEPVAPGWVGRMQMRRIHMSGGRRAWRAYANELWIGRICKGRRGWAEPGRATPHTGGDCEY